MRASVDARACQVCPIYPIYRISSLSNFILIGSSAPRIFRWLRRSLSRCLRRRDGARNNRIGETSRVTGFTIKPRLSKVKAPSNGVTFGGPKTTFEVPRRSPSSKNASPTSYARRVPSARVNSSRSSSRAQACELSNRGQRCRLLYRSETRAQRRAGVAAADSKFSPS